MAVADYADVAQLGCCWHPDYFNARRWLWQGQGHIAQKEVLAVQLFRAEREETCQEPLRNLLPLTLLWGIGTWDAPHEERLKGSGLALQLQWWWASQCHSIH